MQGYKTIVNTLRDTLIIANDAKMTAERAYDEVSVLNFDIYLNYIFMLLINLWLLNSPKELEVRRLNHGINLLLCPMRLGIL